MSNLQDSVLFTPYRLGQVTLRNRTIRSAAFESMGKDFSPTQQLKDYHVSVARGGIGMTTLAYAAVCRSGLSFKSQLWLRPEIVPALRDITDAIHKEGAAASIQIGHCGNMTHYSTAGQIPIVTGGTGFYIQALLKEVDFTESHGELPIRKQLEEKAATEEGAAELYRELSEVDPASAETIHPNNVKRVIRALEYYHETGQKISEHNEEQKQKESPYCSAYFVLNDERSILYDRIDRRVDQMIRDGLVDEVFRLKEMGYTRDLVSMQGLGYKELFPYLAGECTLEEAVYIIKRDTRHFAKRQLTWFRREKDVIWLNKPDFDYDEEKILSYMLDRWNEIVSADAKEEGEQSC